MKHKLKLKTIKLYQAPKKHKFKLGDKVTDGDYTGIVRHIGPLDGWGDKSQIWSDWGDKWDGKIAACSSKRPNGLTYIEGKALKLVKKEVIDSLDTVLKREIANLQML